MSISLILYTLNLMESLSKQKILFNLSKTLFQFQFQFHFPNLFYIFCLKVTLNHIIEGTIISQQPNSII